ncbi:uncharacterized protein LOC143294919 [Babylonia areolata]|uniref:uncharacterized protein LOC143294919 n=1 Tax=Babylonia areolata TaxID=304850 RepID=UPI003FD0E22B
MERDNTSADDGDVFTTVSTQPALVNHPGQKRSLFAMRQKEKDVTGSGLARVPIHPTRPASQAKVSADCGVDKLDQSPGRPRRTRDPVIAWGAADSRGTSVSSAAKNSAGRGHSPSPRRQRPTRWSEDIRAKQRLSTGVRSLSETRRPQDSEISPLRQESGTMQPRQQDLEETALPKVTHMNYSSHFETENGEGKEEEDDDDDEEEEEEEKTTPSSPPTSPTSASRAWDFFEEHTRAMHDLFPNNVQFPKPPGPSSMQASAAFQETMMDLFGYPDYSRPPPPPRDTVTQLARRTLHVNNAKGKFSKALCRGGVEGAEGVEGACPTPGVDHLMADNAQRGWRALRLYLQDQCLSKRTSPAALSWTMLRHTMKGMGQDTEKTRHDLYKRYGIIPSEDANGNVVKVNTMLSERARKTSTSSISSISSGSTTRRVSRERAISSARAPSREEASEPSRGVAATATATATAAGVVVGSTINNKNNNAGKRHSSPQTTAKYLSSSLPAKFSSSSAAAASSSSSAKLSEDLGGRHGRLGGGGGGGGGGVTRGRRIGVVSRPNSSVVGGAITKGAGGGGGGGGGSGLLPLRKISEPVMRSLRSLDS